MAKNNAIDIDIETGGGNTYTFPSATSTLATLDLAETLTNKDLSAASNTLGSASVTAAGALMDSEVINLAQVKAFDSTDYATAAQGSTADSAVQDTGDETIAGIKTFSSSPIVPAPTTDLQAATKKYVDDNGGGGGDLWSDVVDANIIPDGDGTRKIGSSTVRFEEMHTDALVSNRWQATGNPASLGLKDSDGNFVARFEGQTSGQTNYLFFVGTATGDPVRILAVGGDTNIDINLAPKGTGKVQANGIEVATVRGAVNVQTGTTYTLVIGDEYLDGVRMTNTSANTLTLPPNADVALPVGTKVLITQGGAGSTNIAAGAGVTITFPDDVSLTIGKQYSSRVCQKTGTDTWLLI